jgi:heme-degrading monooxygenase HmoA
MRHVIEQDYLPRVCNRPGFVSAQFLEQIDDPDSALLVVCWENQAAVENFNRTNVLEASVQALAVRVPGVRVQRQGYQVSVEIAATEEVATQTLSAAVR